MKTQENEFFLEPGAFTEKKFAKTYSPITFLLYDFLYDVDIQLIKKFKMIWKMSSSLFSKNP